MKVLFICTANVCRSPLAEGYLKHLLGISPVPTIEVASAGVLALAGSGAFECAAEVARLHGFDLSQHRSRQLTAELAHEADEILCMESWQAAKVVQLDPDLMARIALLGKYHPAKNLLFQIRDPRNFDVPCTQEVFDLIRLSVDGLLKKVHPHK